MYDIFIGKYTIHGSYGIWIFWDSSFQQSKTHQFKGPRGDVSQLCQTSSFANVCLVLLLLWWRRQTWFLFEVHVNLQIECKMLFENRAAKALHPLGAIQSFQNKVYNYLGWFWTILWMLHRTILEKMMRCDHIFSNWDGNHQLEQLEA